MDLLFLQIFIGLNLFLMGVVTAIAIRHAYAHFRPVKELEKPKPQTPSQVVRLSPETKEALLKKAESRFDTMLDHSADELQHSLRMTTAQLNKELQKLGSEVSSTELQRYQADLEGLRRQTTDTMSDAQKDIISHQEELKAKMIEEVAAEKQRLIQQMDTKLGDAVSSFLVDTLQHEVDLGAQTAYLIKMLEEHKAELTREIDDES